MCTWYNKRERPGSLKYMRCSKRTIRVSAEANPHPCEVLPCYARRKTRAQRPGARYEQRGSAGLKKGNSQYLEPGVEKGAVAQREYDTIRAQPGQEPARESE